jgi:hypothetical protein
MKMKKFVMKVINYTQWHASIQNTFFVLLAVLVFDVRNWHWIQCDSYCCSGNRVGHSACEIMNIRHWAPEEYVDKSKTINEGVKKGKGRHHQME